MVFIKMKNKNLTIDNLRVLMALVVVLIHCALVIQHKNLIQFILVEGFGRTAVPFFFIISGFYLEGTISKGNILQWLLKIMRMYIIWSLIYLPFQINLIDALLAWDFRRISFSMIPFNLFFGYWQLWFLPAIMIGAVLIKSLSHCHTGKLLKISICVFMISCTSWYLSIHDIISIHNPVFLRNGLFFGFPLMMVGFLLSRDNCILHTANFLTSGYALLFASLLIVLEACVNFYTSNAFHDFTFSSAIFSVSLVVFAIRKPKFIPVKINGSVISTYIYMAHVGFYLFLSHFTGDFFILFFEVSMLSMIAVILIVYIGGKSNGNPPIFNRADK